jgi:hypothetical protein
MRDDMILVKRVSSRDYLRRRGDSDHQKHNPICRKRVSCKSCTRYPCFAGLDNMSSNLAETCQSFTKKRKT